MGISEEDAKDYGLIGCVEMGTPGKEYAKTEVLRINMPMILQLMMNHGRAALTGDRFPLKEDRDLESIASFEDFCAWYKSGAPALRRARHALHQPAGRERHCTTIPPPSSLC